MIQVKNFNLRDAILWDLQNRNIILQNKKLEI